MGIIKPIKIIEKCLLFACFFFYLYPVQFLYMPASTRIILSMAGMVVLVFSITKQATDKKNIYISRNLIRYFVAFAAIIFISVVTIAINGTSDFEFIKYPLSLIFILFAGYLLHFLTRKIYGRINYVLILDFVVAAVLLQVLISLLAFLIPPFSDALQSIQNFSDLDVSKLEETAGFRLNGFGSTFFGAGVINGFALLSIAVLVKQKNIQGKRIAYLSFAFVTILALGAMMARTTLVGGVLAILYLLIPSVKISRQLIKSKTKFFTYIIAIPVALVVAVIFLFPGFAKSMQTAVSFGFEMFVNYSETGEFSTASTNVLEKMYVWPDNLKTYVIGDGKYYNKPGDPSFGYYKSTDVGYLRLIYYFGIIGSLIYFMLQYTAVINAVKSNPNDKVFLVYILFVFVFLLINNFKGFTDLFYLINLFAFTAYKNSSSESKISLSV